MIRSATTVLGLLMLVGVIGVISPANSHADLAKWDAKRVTAAAAELAEHAVVLRDALRRKPPPTLGQAGRHAFHSLREEVQVLASASRRLHRSLEAGDGMEETYPTFRRLVRAGRRGLREVRRIDLGGTTGANIEAVADAIRVLRPFYEPEEPF